MYLKENESRNEAAQGNGLTGWIQRDSRGIGMSMERSGDRMTQTEETKDPAQQCEGPGPPHLFTLQCFCI